MLSPKRVETQKLIAFVKLLSKENNKINYVTEQRVEHHQKDNSFKCLDYKETKITNDLPSKLRSYFDPFIKDFVRHGSTKVHIKNENISIFYSILYTCIPKFAEYPEQQQVDFIKCLRGKLIAYISNNEMFKMNNYEKMKWDKKSIYTTLNNFTVTKLTLKLLADYFSINIFILNILEDKLYVISGNDYFDMFRLNVFISLNNNTFEPLSYLNEKLLPYNNVLVKKIISIHKNILILFNTNLNETSDVPSQLDFVFKLSDFNVAVPVTNTNTNTNTVTNINTDVSSTINKPNKENEYNEITESDSTVFVKDVEVKSHVNNSNNSLEKPHLHVKMVAAATVTITEDIPPVGVVFNISQKMKLDTLQDMATKFNISINKPGTNGKLKLKTKTELVDEIKTIMLK